MELCPRCKTMNAERNHYNNKLICYNVVCGYREGFDDAIPTISPLDWSEYEHTEEKTERYFDPYTGQLMLKAKKFTLCPVCRGWLESKDCEICGGKGVIERTPEDELLVFPTASGATLHGIMPHHSGYPVSRDWEDIDCRATQCLWNVSNKCISPSLARIGDDGKCKGFRLRIIPEAKPEEKIERKIRLD